MDKVKNLYDELIKYDPSLESNKEAVLQLIKKMVDAKPVIAVNPRWKDDFGNELSRHIAESKIAPSPAIGGAQRFAKWNIAMSVLTAFVVVAGASYFFLSSEGYIKKENNNSIKNNPLVHTTGNTNPATGDEKQNAIKDNLDAIAVVSESGGDNGVTNNDDLVYQNTALSIKNTQTISNTTMSTQVDNESAREPVYDLPAIGGGMGGETSDPRSTKSPADPTTAATLSASDTTTANVSEQRVISLLFIDESGSLNMQMLDVLSAYRLPATFVQKDDRLALRLQHDGYELWTNYASLSYMKVTEKEISAMKSLAPDVRIIAMSADQMRSPEILKVLIEKLQSRGYIFTYVSASIKK